MKLLIIGSGGREHALAWRLAQSPRIHRVFVAPGNGGTQRTPGCENLPLTSFPDLIKFARQEDIAFTIVGPEAPLAAGIVDAFQKAGLAIFGPVQAAARLESSKSFAKDFMQRHGIATARYQTFTSLAPAADYLRSHDLPVVIKADGLAAGKGVVVAHDRETAMQALSHSFATGSDNSSANGGVVIEEFLAGEEASFIVICDGRHILPLASSQDHKNLLDADQGPNTGGMGAYSPAPIVSPAMHKRIMHEVIQPAVQGMAQDGIPYTGFLYAGLMIGPGTDEQRSLKVLEFNCRLGDPETQPIMMRCRQGLLEAFEHALNGSLDQAEIVWDKQAALGIVLAAEGYPDTPARSLPIESLTPDTGQCMTFHAGTMITPNGQLQTNGGRIFCVTALGETIRQAQKSAYAAVESTRFPGRQFRRDIGWRALEARMTPD